MSWALVNRGLELFDCDLPESSSQHKESGSNTKASSIHTQRHGYKRAAKQKKRAQQKQKEASKELIQKKVACVLEEYKKNVQTDQTADNLKLLKKIDKRRAPEKYTNQVKQQHSKELDRKTVNRDSLPGKKTTEEKSVFTEEDFEKFNEEWLRLY